MQNQQGQIPVNISEDIKKGRYANLLQVTQSQDETTLDFLFVHPQTGGDIVSRVVVSPAFFKKIVELLNGLAAQKIVIQPDQTKTSRIGFQVDGDNVAVSDNGSKPRARKARK